MKTALILGISGGFGSYVAEELVREGWQLRALMRNPGKLPQGFASVEVMQGDASRIDDVRKAAAGADLIVYGVNAPYHQWESTVVPWLDVTAAVAEETGATILFPGNVYTLNPVDAGQFKDGFAESAPVNPPTRKGELRAEMEARLKTAATNGAKVIIIRCGDFIGGRVPNSWLQHLVKPTRNGYTLQAASEPGLVHTYAYVPDVARAAAELVGNIDQYANFNVFHFRGYRANFIDIAHAIEAATGRPVKIGRFSWGMLSFIGLFVPVMKAVVGMRYLYQHEINLSDAKLESYLGHPVSYTPMAQALLESGALDHPGDKQQVKLTQA